MHNQDVWQGGKAVFRQIPEMAGMNPDFESGLDHLLAGGREKPIWDAYLPCNSDDNSVFLYFTDSSERMCLGNKFDT